MAFLASAAGWLTGTKTGRIVLLILGVLTLGTIYSSKLIRKGRQERMAEEDKRTARQAETRKEIEDDIASDDPGRKRDRLSDWVPGAGGDDKRL